MKEATGELNMAVFVVLVVGVLISFFYFVVWPFIRQSIIVTSQCKNAICAKHKNEDGTVDCKYYENDQDQIGIDIRCVWKG